KKAYAKGVANQRLADDIYFAAKLARAQAKMQRKYENLKSRKDKVFADYKERRRMTELRGKITRLKDDLSSRVLRPTDGHYVPSYLVRGAIDVAAMLDTVGREYDSQGNQTNLFAGFSIYSSAFFTALNNGLVSALISFLRALVFQVAAVLVFPLFWQLDGIWFSIVAAEALSALVSALLLWALRGRYHYGRNPA
ncbi:MAG: hypothetical protein MR579_06610, partial [Bacteroidales bacterium]|nr:hypothetical protein [Bacteroidales bacterium]